MEVKRIYTEDLRVAKALIQRDEAVTRSYFYRQCYPLFNAIYNRYYTDCTCCKEFIDEIYVLLLAPSPNTGRCKMESYRGESSLTTWIKTVCQFYCYEKFSIKGRMEILEPIVQPDTDGDKHDDRYGSEEPDFSRINRADILTVLRLMPNQRYSALIRLRYLEEYSNEETAAALGMSMDNYYNKHKLAKAQYELVLKKEVLHA
jgi:RNA polymerase sigma factor (sigma-70 family)